MRWPTQRAVKKDIGRLDVHCRRFIELSLFVAMASHNLNHQADCSPRGEYPGFVKALDSKTLIIPDWGGNNRLDTFTNIIENNSLGLMFLIPGVDEILRANGSDELRTDEHYKKICAEQDKHPKLLILVHLHEVYPHCAKALMCAEL
ncbi:MAG: pyridoxamine 5'-phosphate oxidase family protein [Gammaproteobacteria bacterium]|nr:pyridoxamine 5'-phosphate oxidase family protein [Gammaproteobacteria bacterium]MDH5728814.1 pyridoxamine 5'-phosphate oxidase family protein [Gammaproteobacteria bacterium]